MFYSQPSATQHSSRTRETCSCLTEVGQHFHFTQHNRLNNSLKIIQRHNNPKIFPKNPVTLHLTCSGQAQQKQHAAHGQQRLHFGCQGHSPHLPRLYILLRLKVRGHASGRGAQQLPPYQPLWVREQLPGPIRRAEQQREAGRNCQIMSEVSRELICATFNL